MLTQINNRNKGFENRTRGLRYHRGTARQRHIILEIK